MVQLQAFDIIVLHKIDYHYSDSGQQMT